MKHKTDKRNLFFTEINKPNRSQTSSSRRELEQNKKRRLYNERPNSKQTGHIFPRQIKTSKIKVLDYMIKDGTQYANLDNIEEFFLNNANENNEVSDLH